MGCFILINLIKSELEYDTHFCFLVQEEVGLRGARAAAFTVAPDFSLVLEATTAADVPDVVPAKQVCRIGSGAVIGFIDRHTIYDREMLRLAFDLANKNGLKVQLKKAVAGGNDAGSIHSSRGGVRTLAVSIPCRYLHAQNSLIAKSDLDDLYTLVALLSKELSGGKL